MNLKEFIRVVKKRSKGPTKKELAAAIKSVNEHPNELAKDIRFREILAESIAKALAQRTEDV